MCDSIAQGGRRCPAYYLSEIQPKQARLAEYEADLKELKTAPEEENEGERDIRENNIAVITTRYETLKRDVDELQRKINASEAGVAELDAARNDTNLTDAERSTAQEQYDKALADVKARKSHRETGYKKQESLRAELRTQGVDKETIDTIIRQASKDRGTPYSRAYSYYDKKLRAQRVERREVKQDHEYRVSEILKQNLGKEETQVALDKEDARYANADKKVLLRLQDTRLALDSTSQGQQELVDDTQSKLESIDSKRDAAIYNDDYDEDARLGLEYAELWGKRQERLNRVRKLHKTQLSDRRSREELFKQIKDASSSAGGDPKAALASYRKPKEVLSNVDPASRITTTRVHLTDRDEIAVNSAFQKSPEFKELGEDGFSDYTHRRLMDSPLSRMGNKTLDELHSEAEVFDKGKRSRHKTSAAGKREVAAGVPLSGADREILNKRAKSMHMTLSSYCRSMLIPGGNPLQIQNDRSARHWSAKRSKVRAMMQEDKLAA